MVFSFTVFGRSALSPRQKKDHHQRHKGSVDAALKEKGLSQEAEASGL
jgi:hypothetical protein